MKIAIIGGGLTGLTTAYYLSKKNDTIFLFESEEKLGGLAQSVRFSTFDIEPLYHHFFKTDKYLLNLCKDLEISNKITWHNSSIGLYWNNKISPFSTPVDLIKFPHLSIFDKLRLGLVAVYLQKSKSWNKMTNISATKWMRKYCGEKAYTIIWKPLLKGKFHNYYNKISMTWLWARINTRSNSKEKNVSREKLGYINGGFDVLISTLHKKIKEQNVSLNLNEQVMKITETKNKKLLLETTRGSYEFDKIICTVPSNIFAKLIEHNQDIPSEYFQKLNLIDYIGVVTILFASTKSLNPYYWININDPDSPFLVFIEHTNLISKENYSNQHIYYLGSYIPHDHKFFKMDDDDITSEFFNYLKKIFPTFSCNEVLEKKVFKFKNAQHIVDLDYINKIPTHMTPLKNTYLANFSQIFPQDRGMNYAIKEGLKMAELLNK